METEKGIYDTSKYQITYYLGAGASCNALPLAKDIGDKAGLAKGLREMASELRHGGDFEARHEKDIERMCLDMEWVADGSDNFGTVDTYAKYLWLSRKADLARLKMALSFFFVYEQAEKECRDKRYLVFLTSVLQMANTFPRNINFISWNYDAQLELAGEHFMKESFQLGAGVSVHSPPLIVGYPAVGREFILNAEQSVGAFQLVHVNGTSGYYFNNVTKVVRSDFLNYRNGDLDKTLDIFFEESRHKHDMLYFAWEAGRYSKSNVLKKRLEIAKNIASKTDILVVIGYSFPYFNREIDDVIFKKFKENNLSKIIFQDPNLDGSFLRQQFGLSDEIKIEHVEQVDNFYLPQEL